MNIETLINTVLSSNLENDVKVALLEVLFEKRRELTKPKFVESANVRSKPYKPDVSYIPTRFQ